MDFSVFDTRQIAAYAKEAKSRWGATKEYQDYVQKSSLMGKFEQQNLFSSLMRIFEEFGELRAGAADDEAAQVLVQKLQDFISEHFYACSKETLVGLGKLYVTGEDFRDNIDRAGGGGTAEFVSQAIAIYCAD